VGPERRRDQEGRQWNLHSRERPPREAAGAEHGEAGQKAHPLSSILGPLTFILSPPHPTSPRWGEEKR